MSCCKKEEKACPCQNTNSAFIILILYILLAIILGSIIF